MNEKKPDIRKNIVYLVLGLLLTAEFGMVFYRSGVVRGVSGRADRLRVYTTAALDDATIQPGDILDRNGEWIVMTTEETEDDESYTIYRDDYAYSQLVGYTGPRNLDLLADCADEVIQERIDSRLMAFLDNEYWGKNGLYAISNIDGTKGQDAILTIDNGLQQTVYQLLLDEFEENDAIGSAVVLDAKTGEILADVSFPTYNYNDLSGALVQMNEDAEKKKNEPGYPVTYQNPMTPGSIFKVLIGAALIDNGMEDYVVNNTSFTTEDGWTCNATEFSSPDMEVLTDDRLDLETAMVMSSNVYFAQAALDLGPDVLGQMAEKYQLIEGKSSIPMDFGDMRYQWKITDENDDVLAQTGFGQGKTELTTIHAAMITQGIANNGQMMKPYMVKELRDTRGKVVYTGEPELLGEVTSGETSNKLAEIMHHSAMESSGLHDMPRCHQIFEEYRVAGKTGTAENGDETAPNNAWYISFAPADDPQYVVVVNQCRTDKMGWEMMETASEIYDYLFTTYNTLH